MDHQVPPLTTTPTKQGASSRILQLYQDGQLDEIRILVETAKADRTFDCQSLIDLAKSSKDAATFVKELINAHNVDATELADKIAKEIISDLERYIDGHLEKYQKYTLNAPQMSSGGARAKFFNLISLLKDVSILGRKLLEASPRFESCKSASPLGPNINPSDRRSLISSARFKDSKSQMSEDDATSDDLLAALIESSSSDDFLVLSSSLDSITVRDMILTALLLITSHECFTLSHDIQGVVMVLRRTKFMIKNILAPKDQMELVTKLLTAISRYNEMNYVFDLFRDRNQFEMLLSKGVEKTPELRIALFNYVKKNPEFYALVTLNFSMFREIAESLEASAIKRLDKLIQARKNKNNKKKKKVSLIIASGATTAAAAASSISGVSGSNGGGGGGAGTMPASPAIAGATAATAATAAADAASVAGSAFRQQDGGSNFGREQISMSGTMKKSNSIATSLSNIGAIGGGGANNGGSLGMAIGDSGAGSNVGTISPDSNNKPLYSKDSLNLCLVELADASDCYAKAGCYKRSNDCEHRAKLIALQLALLPSETNVLDLQQSELNDLIVSFESFLEAHIVAEAYAHHFTWRQALFRNVVLRGQSNYLDDYCLKCDLSSALVMELVLLYKQYIANSNNHLSHAETTRLAQAMELILDRLEDVELKCKLYTQLGLADAKEALLQRPAIRAHLKDLKLA